MIKITKQLVRQSSRRGAILVLAAFMLIVIFAFASFTVDTGYMTIVKTELQSAADSCALAAASRLGKGPAAVRETARELAAMNTAAGEPVTLQDSDIEVGLFDLKSKTFTPNEASPNAVRVTARVTNHPTFFAPLLGKRSFDLSATAISMLNPRDIVFVIDLSGSMNDDTEPGWSTSAINSQFGPLGFPNVANKLMQDVFEDFNFGIYPGISQYVGTPLGILPGSNAYANLVADKGPLSSKAIPAQYRISKKDSDVARKKKAYGWIIDVQMSTVMPNALPKPNSTSNYGYWEKYLDYVLAPYSSGGSSLPPDQDSDRIDDFNNPNRSTFPSASSSAGKAYQGQIGYLTYVQFMMDWGRDRSPEHDNSTNSNPNSSGKTPLSLYNPDCPLHAENTAAGSFLFPPREQPTHAVRRSLIAALKVIEDLNVGLPNGAGDQVSIVTFDAIDQYHAPELVVSLTGDYRATMQACTRLQAVGDINASTATENGLIKARQHIAPVSQGGKGRNNASKVVVLLTDGVPNIYSSSSSTINSYINANPDSNFYSGSSSQYNSVLMQASQMKGDNVSLFGVGMGLGADLDFMDRIARINGTDNDGLSPRGTGNPSDYEQRLTEIFEEILDYPGTRLVQ